MMTNLNGRFVLGVVLWCIIFSFPTDVVAAPITFSFTGVVSHVDAKLFPTVTAGQTLSGSYTFDSGTALNQPGNRFNSAITAFSANIGSYNAVLAAGTNFIAITNNRGIDRYTLSAPLIPAPGAPGSAFRLRMELVDPSGDVFSNRALPTTPPSLSSFATNRWRLVFEDTNGTARIRGVLTSLTAVPVPTGVILFGVGLVALAGLGAGSWQRRKTRHP